MNMNTMNTTTPPPTPETGEGSPSLANFTIQKLERELNEAREQIASCAINTNVRLFDLVRQMRAPLHEDGLITDEEYFWLCGGCEMANSPEGGSPSPRRLEDYDVLSEKLQAMERAGAEQARRADENREWALRAERERGEARIHFRRTIDELADEQQAHGLTKGKLTECQMQLNAMREAIREAIDSLHKCSRVIGAPKTYDWADEDVCDAAYNSAQAALTKLQPFIKP